MKSDTFLEDTQVYDHCAKKVSIVCKFAIYDRHCKIERPFLRAKRLRFFEEIGIVIFVKRLSLSDSCRQNRKANGLNMLMVYGMILNRLTREILP